MYMASPAVVLLLQKRYYRIRLRRLAQSIDLRNLYNHQNILLYYILLKYNFVGRQVEVEMESVTSIYIGVEIGLIDERIRFVEF